MKYGVLRKSGDAFYADGLHDEAYKQCHFNAIMVLLTVHARGAKELRVRAIDFRVRDHANMLTTWRRGGGGLADVVNML